MRLAKAAMAIPVRVFARGVDVARRGVGSSRVAHFVLGPQGPSRSPAPDPMVVLLVIAAVAGLGFRSTPAGPLLGVAVVTGIGLRMAFRWGRGDTMLAVILVGALMTRLLMVASDTTLDIFQTPDALKYHVRAASLASAIEGGEPWVAADNLKTSTFEALLAPLNLWFGSSMFVGRALNCVLGMAAVFNVYRIGSVVFHRRAGLAGAALFAVLPSAVAGQAELLREALIMLLTTEAVYLLVATRLTTIRSAVLVCAAIAPLVLLRLPLVLVLLVPLLLVASAALASAWRAAAGGAGRGRLRSFSGPLVVFAGVACAAGVASMTTASAGLLYSGWLDLERLEWVRGTWAVGDSAYGVGVEFNSLWDVAGFAPVGAAYFALAPFPWQVNSKLAAVAFAENVLLAYPVVVMAGMALLRNPRVLGAGVVAAMVVAGVFLFGLIEGNVGTAVRHRLALSWGLFVLAGPVAASLHGRLAGALDSAPPIRPTAQQGVRD